MAALLHMKMLYPTFELALQTALQTITQININKNKENKIKAIQKEKNDKLLALRRLFDDCSTIKNAFIRKLSVLIHKLNEVELTDNNQNLSQKNSRI